MEFKREGGGGGFCGKDVELALCVVVVVSGGCTGGLVVFVSGRLR